MGNELAKTQGTEINTPRSNFAGAATGIDRSDILMPSILLMQGQSELVGEEKAQVGDIVKSTTAKIIGNKQKPVQIIPLKTFKTWRNFVKIGEKFEYRGQEPYFEKDKDLPWSYERDNQMWRRDKSINLYCLLVEEIQGEGAAMKKAMETGELPEAAMVPVLVCFTRTSFQMGKVVATHFATAEHYNLAPWVSVLKLGTHMEKNDKGQFYVFDVERLGPTSKDYLPICEKWFGILSQGDLKIQVDESGLTEGPVKSEDVPF